MAGELATAYLQLIPSLRGAEATITKELGGIDVSGSGRSIGGSLLSGISGTLGHIGSEIMSGITATVRAGGALLAAAITAIGYQVLKGGWDRALAINEAKTKIEVLLRGTETSVEAVMESVKAGVLGTAYSIADAGNVAATALAAGVKPGEELTKMLSQVADAAAITGRDFSEIGYIFNQVAAQGRLTGNTLNMLEKSGLGVSAALSDHLGVSLEEVRELVSRGEVDFQTFQAAMDKFGGAAVELGNTTLPGVTANIQASFARMGATLWDPIIEALIPALNTIRESLTELEPYVQKAFAALAETIAPKIEAAANAIAGFIDKIKGALEGGAGLSGFSDIIAGLMPIIGGLLGAFGGLAAQIPIIGRLFTGINPVFGVVVGLLVGMLTQSEALREAFGTAFKIIGEAVMRVAPLFTDLLAQAGPMLGRMGDALAPLVVAVADFAAALIDTLAPVLADFIGNLMPAITRLIEALAPAIAGILSALQPLISVLGFIIGIVGDIIVLIIDIITWLINLITETGGFGAHWEEIWDAVSSFFIGIWEGIVSFFTGIWDAICSAVDSAVTFVSDIIIGAVTAIVTFWTDTWTAISSFFTGIWDGIVSFVSSAIEAVSSTISNVLSAIKSTWDNIWNGIKTFFSNIWDGLKSTAKNSIDNVYNTVVGIKDRILSFFSGAASWLVNAGKNIINGLLEGIKNAVSGVIDFVSGIGDKIAAVKGPKEYDLALLRPAAGWIMQGFREEITAQIPSVLSIAAGIGPQIADAINVGDIDVSGVGGGTKAAPATVIQIGDVTYLPNSEIARVVSELASVLAREKNMGQVMAYA